MHKARLFQSVLGIEQQDWEYLRETILEQIEAAPVTAIRSKPPYGVEYELRMVIEGLTGVSHPIITSWMLPAEGPPWLTSAYPEVPRRA